jgi:hypothetical protein
LQKDKMTYIEDGMNKIIPDTRQDRRKAANSSATADQAAADRKVLDSLSPEDRELVLDLMNDYPTLTAEKALRMLNAAGM